MMPSSARSSISSNSDLDNACSSSLGMSPFRQSLSSASGTGDPLRSVRRTVASPLLAT